MSKPVSTTLEDEDYEALKALAAEEDRNISGQVRHMLRAVLGGLRRDKEYLKLFADGNFVGDNGVPLKPGELARARQEVAHTDGEDVSQEPG